MKFGAPEPLSAKHSVREFDCGKEPLNQYLKRFALTNAAAGSARTFVICSPETDEVIGYYALAAASVEIAKAPERVSKGLPKHPIPVVLLGRLAVHTKYQGQGLGKALLRDALLRSLGAADQIGIRAILVHAKDGEAAQWYTKFGFSSSPTDPLHLLLLVKDLRQTLK